VSLVCIPVVVLIQIKKGKEMDFDDYCMIVSAVVMGNVLSLSAEYIGRWLAETWVRRTPKGGK